MVLPLAVDAQILAGIALLPEADLQQQAAAGVVGGQAGGFHPVQRQLLESELDDRRDGLAHEALAGVALADPVAEDRKSVVSGKSVSVRVDLGGRRIIKKKNKCLRKQELSHIIPAA